MTWCIKLQYDAMWLYSRSQITMVAADGLVPIWHQDICNHHDNLSKSTQIRSIPTWRTGIAFAMYSNTDEPANHGWSFQVGFAGYCVSCVYTSHSLYHTFSLSYQATHGDILPSLSLSRGLLDNKKYSILISVLFNIRWVVSCNLNRKF